MARLRIKEVAESKGILQSRLQLDARVTPPLLNRYWNNKTPSIDLDELEKIANALGVDASDLVESGNREEAEEDTGNKTHKRGRPRKRSTPQAA